jgi:hypothetical protein
MELVIPCFVVNLVSEAGRINDRERDTGSFFIQFQFYGVLATVIPIRVVKLGLRTNGDGLDSDAFLEVGIRRVIGIFSCEDLLSTERVHKGGSS